MYTLLATNLATYPTLSTLAMESLSGLSHNKVMSEMHDMFRELGHDIRPYVQYVTVRRNNMDMTIESLILPQQYVLTWASKHDDRLRLRIILELAQKTSEMLQAVPVATLEQMVSNGNIRVWFSKENVDKSLAVLDLENLLVTKSQYGKSVASTVIAELLGMDHSQLRASIRKMFINVGLDGNHNLIAVEGKQVYALTRELALFVITKYSTVARFTVVCRWLELVSGNANLFRILEDAMFKDGWGIEIGSV